MARIEVPKEFIVADPPKVVLFAREGSPEGGSFTAVELTLPLARVVGFVGSTAMHSALDDITRALTRQDCPRRAEGQLEDGYPIRWEVYRKGVLEPKAAYQLAESFMGFIRNPQDAHDKRCGYITRYHAVGVCDTDVAVELSNDASREDFRKAIDSIVEQFGKAGRRPYDVMMESVFVRCMSTHYAHLRQHIIAHLEMIEQTHWRHLRVVR